MTFSYFYLRHLVQKNDKGYYLKEIIEFDPISF